MIRFPDEGACRGPRTPSETCAFFPAPDAGGTPTTGCDFDVSWRRARDSLMFVGSREPVAPDWGHHCSSADESEFCKCGCEALIRAAEEAEE